MHYPQPLGVGFPYMSIVSPELYQSGLVDFVEIAPETLCRERRKGNVASLDLVPLQFEQAQATCAALPIVVHGVELSIGSAHGWNTAYLDMLDRFQSSWPFRWHSEHLGFQTIAGDKEMSLEIGVPLPLPTTAEAVRLVAQRCSEIRRRYGVPFLLENPAHYLADLPADPEIGDEIDFMNQITARSRCGQLLDLHNLYCNSVNHKFDAIAAIDRIALDRVVEIHVAGGSWRDGFWMDAHDGRVPPQVWDMLEYTLPRAPNVAGVVFEVLDDHVPRLGASAIAEELARARKIWQRCRTRALQAA
jgi:uncharacterized protein (UPF0276 family)